MRKQASTYSGPNSRTGVLATHIWLRVLGLISPIALPIIAALIHQRFTIFHYPGINTVIPAGFFLAGIATGALLREWWSVTYIFVLGSVLTILAVALGNGDPGSEGGAVTLVFAFMTIPLTLLGAALGTLMGKALERYTVLRGNKWPG